MKTFRHILLYLQAAIFLGLVSACSDDFSGKDSDEHEPFSTGITLRVPMPANLPGSRGDATPMGDETKINTYNGKTDLYLFAFSQNGEHHIKGLNLPAPDNHDYSEIDDGYLASMGVDKNGEPVKIYSKFYADDRSVEYKIPLDANKYRFYLIANLSEYASSTDYENFDEAKVKALVLNYSTSQTTLKAGHLPMACLPEDVVESDGSGNVDIHKATVTKLHCNLSFLCSKVRYTILFDNTDADISKTQFGSRNFLDFGSANTVTNVVKETPFQKPTTATTPATHEDSFTLPLNRVKWPDEGKDYPNTTEASKEGVDNKSEDLEVKEDAFTDSDYQRAWQGVVYLPENLSTSKRTTLNFDGKVNGTSANPYTVELVKGNHNGSAVTSSTLSRANFYDLTLLAKGRAAMDINFTVEDWDPVKIFYELHGPYYLRIEETKVNVEPGVVYSMWIDSNAPEVTGHSPMVTIQENGENVSVPLYIIEQDKDNKNLLTVRINPRVKSKYFADITANSTQYNFFHIEAGNIHKKIEIYPFELELFLRVPSDDPVIKVREEIGSGKYSGSYPVTIETNYDEFMITPVDWKKLFGSSTDVTTNTSTLIWLEDEKGNKVQFNTWIKASASGVMNYQLKYAGLNDGETFWTDLPQDMKLKIKGRTEDGASQSEEEKVNIKTYPSSDDYVIHVKVPSGWKKPHIYVYQCLEFPADTDDSDRANKAIATSSSGTTAALEYSFTGKIAFKGWNIGLYNNPNAATGKTSNGFYYFSGDDTWDPSTPNAKHYYMRDFCEAYRQTITTCTKCTNDEYKRLWPGIIMKYEKAGTGGDWYVFKLTGVATPGKALLMWANDHDNDGKGDRYPYGGDNPQPGIPLFNFDNREGWIDITSDNAKSAGFQPSNPDESEDEGDDPVYKYRIYFENGNNTISVWVDGSDSKLVDNAAGTVYEGYKNGGGGFDYKYVDFEHAGDRQTTIKYRLSTDSKDGTVGKYLEDFSKDGDRFSVHIWKGTTYPNHPG